jgi:hypothetical protein
MSERSAAARPMKRRSAVIGLALAALVAAAGDAEARRSGQARRQVIDMVVIHSTGGPTCDTRTGKAIWVRAGTLDDNLRAIEAHPTLGIHYMIDRDGTLRASVPEDQVAHHVFRVSGRSIAIELINDGDGLDPFPELAARHRTAPWHRARWHPASLRTRPSAAELRPIAATQGGSRGGLPP